AHVSGCGRGCTAIMVETNDEYCSRRSELGRVGRQAWMAYDHGRWKPHETERVTQKVMACMDAVLQREYTWNACTGVEHLLRTRLAQILPLETPGWLPFQNGALCLATMTLHPHRPERPFTWQLPHAYDPQATCPMTQAWLHETV